MALAGKIVALVLIVVFLTSYSDPAKARKFGSDSVKAAGAVVTTVVAAVMILPTLITNLTVDSSPGEKKQEPETSSPIKPA